MPFFHLDLRHVVERGKFFNLLVDQILCYHSLPPSRFGYLGFEFNCRSTTDARAAEDIIRIMILGMKLVMGRERLKTGRGIRMTGRTAGQALIHKVSQTSHDELLIVLGLVIRAQEGQTKPSPSSRFFRLRCLWELQAS
jgi:hypothetical protein